MTQTVTPPSPQQPKKKKSLLRKLFWWLVVPIFSLLLIVFIIAAFFADKVGKFIIDELKTSLKTELTVNDVDMSIISTFPYASVNLKGVTLKDVTGKTNVLSCERLSFRLGLWGLISGEYDVRGIVVENGEAFLYTDKKGRNNYDVMKDESKTAEKEVKPKSEDDKLKLSIRQAILRNMKLIYADEREGTEVAIRVDQASFSGDFNGDKYDLESDAAIYCGYIMTGGTKYLEGKNIAYSTTTKIDNGAGRYELGKTLLNLDGNKFDVTGSITSATKATNFDLLLNGTDCQLGSLLALAAADGDALKGLESNADLNFVATIKGRYDKDHLPEINAQMGLDNGKLTHPELNGAVTDVGFKLNFTTGTSGNGEDGRMDLSNFKGQLNGNPIDMKLSMKGLKNPLIDFAFNGKISLEQVYGLIGSNVTDGGGMLHIERLNVNGRLNDMMSMSRAQEVNASGAISLYDAAIEQNGVKMSIPQGRIALDDNTFTISDFQIRGSKTDIALNGEFNNLIPVLLADSVNSKHAQLDFHTTLNADLIDVEELMRFMGSDSDTRATRAKKAEATVEKEEEGPGIGAYIKGTFNSRIAMVRYGKVTVSNFNGTLLFGDKELNIANLQANAFGGTIIVTSRISLEQAASMTAHVITKGVDITRLLSEWDNFDQTQITDKNIKGALDADVNIKASWDKLGNFQQNNLYTLADITLRDGELIDVELMKQFSKFVKVKDLEHVVFTDLRNQFEIKDGIFVMPAMFVQSNAVNLSVAGKQEFAGPFAFWIKVNGGQVLMNKFKKYNNAEPLKAKRNGLFNIHVSVYGNYKKEEYNWKFDKKGVKAALAGQTDAAFTRLHGTLRSQGIDAIQEPDDLEDIPEYGEKTPKEFENGGEMQEMEFK